ncbi:MAG: hypothetical protein ACJ76B_05710 [Solirubrobacterales bacterium]
MKELPAAELEAMLAEEFGAQGWDYSLGVSRALAGGLAEGSPVDPTALAERVSTGDLKRIGIERDDLVVAIERSVGAYCVATRPTSQSVSITINDQRYQLHVSDSARVEGSYLNLGGTQVNVDIDVSRDQVLAGVEALLRAGLAGEWDPAAAEALGEVISARGDLSANEISALTQEVGKVERPDPGRIRALLEKVAVGAASSTLSSGLTTGLGLLLQNPPL